MTAPQKSTAPGTPVGGSPLAPGETGPRRELDAQLAAEAAAAAESYRALAASRRELGEVHAELRACRASAAPRLLEALALARERFAPTGTRRARVAGYAGAAAHLAVLGTAKALRSAASRTTPPGPAAPAASPPADPEHEGLADAWTTAAPDVAVVVPVYNARRSDPRYLIEALDSLAAQTVPPSAVVVVDDGSSDDSAALLRDYASAHQDVPIRLVTKENGGQSSARNAGVAACDNEWVAFLDQDDKWTPDHLERIAPHMTADAGLVYTDLDRIDARGLVTDRALHVRHGLGGRNPKTTLEDVLFEDLNVPPGVMTVRRSLFERVGGFDERLSGCEDDDLFVRLMLESGGAVAYVPVTTLLWRLYEDNYGYSTRMLESRLLYWRKLIDSFAGAGRDAELARRISLRFLFVFLVEAGMRREAGRPLADEYLLATGDLLPYVGEVDRTVFGVVRWAWRSTSRPAHYVRAWYLRGLEPARPGAGPAA